uniref:Uncharacterized protein n=1 Tax=Archaeoglobus fulgidus TaxID=2234 RepID=A0A7J2TJZ4_ARCFL
MNLRISDFEDWLRSRGYDKMMGEQNFREFLKLGFATLLFSNSNLLVSFLLHSLKVQGEREKARFEIAKKIKAISATKDEIRIDI